MNKKQRKTYDAIFVDPIRRNIVWDDVVNLIQSLGGIITQGDGSRVRFDLNKISLNIHSTHPQKELKRYQIKALREFLIKAGVD
ncbi:type II toxin-antitoxin system HicA family toxin [Microcystis aeruginosa CS-563/04]|uniref:type II toxin-antitoxin system HicA family toxin n=1 Tax=Microcystis aeruginosa TaxID=1126 RepID=UPI00232C735F|nr:type II toxin-antitoxin system HicA family toxin [Microcystis aeruginosa]MDB9423159.1 type II toxin-antitoxin system HicA family toxin [Microcystis aeruginosa CS-563/04]